ncbi:MAG: thiamine pyrophosphate-binding protein [Patescibacteria group bacterium]|nr:thiamine pyrophosphate-binding protein [Patescibacteria group bacterium]
MKNIQFLTGCEAAVKGAIEAGAKAMFGYPITPSTEILQGWIAAAETNDSLKYLQTEDETSAGFAVCGALLAGTKAFTATAGPGNTLMQDPLSMAENLRLPFVCIVMQRGGPSTGTVNFSQQEVNLSAFGGNGDGLRFVYSASTVEEMYTLTIKAFSVAWKYQFPTFVLGDGHLAKMRMKANLTKPINSVNSSPLLKEGETPTFLRNCYSSEESFGQKLKVNIEEWKAAGVKIEEFEPYKLADANELIIAHGSVADAVKDAVDILRNKKRKIGLFRPITIHPIAKKQLQKAVSRVKKVYVIESSLNQLSRIVKYETSGIKTPIVEIPKPAESFSAEEIVQKIIVS